LVQQYVAKSREKSKAETGNERSFLDTNYSSSADVANLWLALPDLRVFFGAAGNTRIFKDDREDAYSNEGRSGYASPTG
jgi:hypothetical protein